MGCGVVKQAGAYPKIQEASKENIDIAETNIIKFGVFVKMKKKGLYKVNEVPSSQEFSLPASGEFMNTFCSINSQVRHSH